MMLEFMYLDDFSPLDKPSRCRRILGRPEVTMFELVVRLGVLAERILLRELQKAAHDDLLNNLRSMKDMASSAVYSLIRFFYDYEVSVEQDSPMMIWAKKAFVQAIAKRNFRELRASKVGISNYADFLADLIVESQSPDELTPLIFHD